MMGYGAGKGGCYMRCGLSRRRPGAGRRKILLLAAIAAALLVAFLEFRLKPVLEEITRNEAAALSVEAVNTACLLYTSRCV